MKRLKSVEVIHAAMECYHLMREASTFASEAQMDQQLLSQLYFEMADFKRLKTATMDDPKAEKVYKKWGNDIDKHVSQLECRKRLRDQRLADIRQENCIQRLKLTLYHQTLKAEVDVQDSM